MFFNHPFTRFLKYFPAKMYGILSNGCRDGQKLAQSHFLFNCECAAFNWVLLDFLDTTRNFLMHYFNKVLKPATACSSLRRKLTHGTGIEQIHRRYIDPTYVSCNLSVRASSHQHERA